MYQSIQHCCCTWCKVLVILSHTCNKVIYGSGLLWFGVNEKGRYEGYAGKWHKMVEIFLLLGAYGVLFSLVWNIGIKTCDPFYNWYRDGVGVAWLICFRLWSCGSLVWETGYFQLLGLCSLTVTVVLQCLLRYMTCHLHITTTASPNILRPLCQLSQLWADWPLCTLCRVPCSAWCCIKTPTSLPIHASNYMINCFIWGILIKYSTTPRKTSPYYLLIHGGS